VCRGGCATLPQVLGKTGIRWIHRMLRIAVSRAPRGVATKTPSRCRIEETHVKQTVGAYLLARLQAWGVERVFAYPGDGINGILGAWATASSSPRFIQARHEEMAGFEAVGYAKYSGQLGVCMATSGPGAIHLLNGLYDAKLDHVPVLAIVGQ